jgi:hypothetical protein
VVRRRTRTVALGIALLGMLRAERHADAHPLHSTITELVLDPARGTVRATIRVFSDDLRAAVMRAARGVLPASDGPAWDGAALAYAARVVSLRNARGEALALRPCGTRRTGDLVWLCLEGPMARDAGVLHVRNAMLCEVYEDQVNVVQGTIGGTRRSLLFMRGDPFKPFR